MISLVLFYTKDVFSRREREKRGEERRDGDFLLFFLLTPLPSFSSDKHTLNVFNYKSFYIKDNNLWRRVKAFLGG